MKRKHLARISINEGIDFDMWGARFKHGENWRGEQDVPMMTQLYNQSTSDLGKVDAICRSGIHGEHINRKPPLQACAAWSGQAP